MNHNTEPQKPKSNRKLDYKWVVVGVCFLTIMITLGFCSSPGSLYLDVVPEVIGVSRTAFSLMNTFRFVANAIVNLFFGFLVHKFGTKKLMCAGILCLAGAMALSATATNISRETTLPRRADPSMFDISGCEKVARRVSDEIFYELEDVKEYVSETVLMHKTLIVDLPVRRVTPEERDRAEEAIRTYFERRPAGDINFEDNARLQIHSGTLSRFEVQKTKNIYDIEIHVARLGDVAFATNPFELFLNYGNQIRARSLAKQTFLTQLCCGTYGYLPTEKAEKGSHYSAFVSSGTTGHVGGDMLVRKTLKEINELFTEE